MIEDRNETNVVHISDYYSKENSMIRMKPFNCHFQNTRWKFLQIYFFNKANNQRKEQELLLSKMSTSKKTLSARLQRKTLSLSKKIKLFNYKISYPTIGCRDIVEVFIIGKTSAATITKNEEKLCKHYAVICDCAVICILLLLSYKKLHCWWIKKR